jgi:hypothetical protein
MGRNLKMENPVATFATESGKRGWMLLIPKGSDAEVPPPRVFCRKSPQAIENKRWEREKERKERKRVRKQLKTKGRQIGFATEAQRHRAREQGYTPTIVGRPVATGSMRKLLRMEEILALRGARDGRSSRLRKHTRGCGGREGPNRDTVSNLG